MVIHCYHCGSCYLSLILTSFCNSNKCLCSGTVCTYSGCVVHTVSCPLAVNVLCISLLYIGATVDTKNALRTFLTSSSDFSSDASARQREGAVPVACTSSLSVSEVRLAVSTRPPPLPASIASVRPTAHYSADHGVRPAASTEGPAIQSLPTSRVETTSAIQKSPRQSAPCLPAAAIFPTITDIARFSINSTGHPPPLAVPFLVARPQAVEPGVRARQLFGTLAVTSVPQPSTSLGSFVLPAGFMAPGSALRLPVAPVPPAAVSVVTTTAAPLSEVALERSPVSCWVTAAADSLTSSAPPVDHQSVHHDVLSPVNWKLKMARDHVSTSEFSLHLEFLMIVVYSSHFCTTWTLICNPLSLASSGSKFDFFAQLSSSMETCLIF